MRSLFKQEFASLTNVVLALFTVLSIVSCQQEDDYVTGDPKPSVSPYNVTNANVMVINASPGAKQTGVAPYIVNYALNNNVIVNTATPPVALDYAYLNTPTYRATLATPQSQIRFLNKEDGKSLAAVNFNINQNSSHSVFFIDSVTRPAGQRAIQVADVLTAPAAGRARVRFLHFAPNAPEVRVLNITGNPATPAVLFSPRRYAELSRTGVSPTFSTFSELNAGTYDLDVRLTAGDASVLTLTGVTLVAGKIYTIYARGFVGGVGEQALGATIIQHN